MSNFANVLRSLARFSRKGVPEISDLAHRSRTILFDHRKSIEAVLASLHMSVGTPKTVTHGDLHLGQVLRSLSHGTLYFVDFEGEPDRAPRARSPKLPPLRDVATMNRSFAYVNQAVRRSFGRRGRIILPGTPPTESQWLENGTWAARLDQWETAAVTRFSRRYMSRSSLYPTMDMDDALRIVRGWMMEKAIYELRYELTHRPANFPIPLEGILALASGDRVDAQNAPGSRSR